MEEKTQLLLNFLERNPNISKELRARTDNDLEYGLSYINARECIKRKTLETRTGFEELQQKLDEENVSICGSWDDHVERLEFYRERMITTQNTLTCLISKLVS
jgi:hypothetical protein